MKLFYKFNWLLSQVLAILMIILIQVNAFGTNGLLILQQQDNYSVYGNVADEDGNPLPFVNVYIEGTSQGSTTNEEGNYRIDDIEEKSITLIASFTGYETFRKSITFLNKTPLQVNIVLHENVRLLDQIVVTGTTNPKTTLESSVAISTINTKSMEQRVAQSNADLLKFIPGLWVESSGGEGPSNVFVRGFPSTGGYTYMGLMEDGLPLFQVGYNSIPSPDQFYKTDATIKSVEAIRGGTSPIVMQGAAGAVANYISKTGTQNFSGVAKLMYDPLYKTERVDLDLGGPMGKGFFYNIGGFYRIGKGPYDYDYNANKGGQVQGNIQKRFKKGFVKLKLRYINDKVNWNLPSPYYFHKDGTLGEIPGFKLRSAGAAVNAVDTKFSINLPGENTMDGNLEHGFNTELFSVGFEFFYDLGKGWTISNKFRLDRSTQVVNSDMAVGVVPLDTSATYYYTDGTQIDDVSSLNGNGLSLASILITNDGEFDNIVDRLELKKHWERNDLTIGVEYFNFQLSSKGASALFTKEVKNAPRILLKGSPHVPPFFALAFVDPSGVSRSDGTENTYSVYFTDEYQISSRFRLDFGFRYDYKSIKGNNASKEGAPAVPPVNGPGFTLGEDIPFDDNAGNWAATLGMNFKINEKSALFIRGSKAYSGKKLGDYTADGVDIEELKNLKDRRIIQAEAGYKFSSAKFGLFSSLIYANVHNVISQIFIPTPQRSVLRQQIYSSSRTLSLEIQAQYIPVKNLMLKLTTTLQNAIYTDLKFTAREGTIVEGQEFDWSDHKVDRFPAAMVDFTVAYNIKKFNVFANYRYYSNRWSTAANNVKLKGYGELYGGAGYEIFKGFTIDVKGANLTNTVALTAGNMRGDQFINVDDLDGKPWLSRRTLPISVIIQLAYSF